MEKYDHKKIEKKWQQRWEKSEAFRADKTQGEKLYVLDMFPYPSGAGLHVGHVEGYTATDVYSRMKRAQGFNVLHPMGWDAFGLPAENYAIKTGIPPEKTTNDAIENFTKQIKHLGLSYDWSREVGTHTPEYYKWTQWFFLFLYKNGLAEKRLAKVNWCPKDQTVLANEQTVSESGEKGVCVRCGTKVIQKDLEQWFFKITDFADALVDDLDSVDWPESTKINQRNWIGRSEGAEIEFALTRGSEKIKVFTTRPDTLYGATYVVLAPEHPFIEQFVKTAENKKEIESYVEAAKNKTDLERQETEKNKTGVEIRGIKAINPANKEEIPVFVADYVLGGYGTGAIMAVPGHDERDYQFAKKFNLPIKRVVEPLYVANPGQEGALDPALPLVKRNAICAIVYNPKNDTYLCISWKGMLMHGLVTGGVDEGEDVVEAAKREVREETGYKNLKLVKNPGIANHTQFYHRVKKQNRWARFTNVFLELENDERDPVDEKEAALHEVVWLKKEELENFFSVFEGRFMVELINNPDYIHTGNGVLANSGEFDWMDSEEAKKKITESVDGTWVRTYRLRDWLISRQRYWGAPIPVVYDPQGKPHAIPEEHLPWVLPVDVEFKPTGVSPLGQSKELLERTEKIFGKGWRPEVDTMDTFVCSSWYYFRFADPHNANAFASNEAITKWLPVNLYMGGAEHTVLHLMYARFFTKALKKHGVVNFDEPFLKLRHQGTILAEDSSKMSKSKGNVINPDEVVENYGADTLRLYEMFMGPLEAQKPWSTKNILGTRRFLERVWKYVVEIWLVNYEKDIKDNIQNVDAYENNAWDPKLESELQSLILKVTNDIENLKFNTAISSMMNYLKTVYEETRMSNNLGTETIMSKSYQMTRKQLNVFLMLLSPFAPHIVNELWEKVGNSTRLEEEPWPIFDESKIIRKTITIAVQVNGKVRGTIEISPSASQNEAESAARATPAIAKWLTPGTGQEGEAGVKVIYVPGRVLSFAL